MNFCHHCSSFLCAVNLLKFDTQNIFAAVNTEKEYKYTSGGGVSHGKCHKKANPVQANFTGFVRVKEGNEHALMEAAYSRPIISVAIDASHNSFQLYDSGIYNEPKCKSKDADLDHGVAVIGYGVKGKHDYVSYWITTDMSHAPLFAGAHHSFSSRSSLFIVQTNTVDRPQFVEH